MARKSLFLSCIRSDRDRLCQDDQVVVHGVAAGHLFVVDAHRLLATGDAVHADRVPGLDHLAEGDPVQDHRVDLHVIQYSS